MARDTSWRTIPRVAVYRGLVDNKEQPTTGRSTLSYGRRKIRTNFGEVKQVSTFRVQSGGCVGRKATGFDRIAVTVDPASVQLLELWSPPSLLALEFSTGPASDDYLFSLKCSPKCLEVFDSCWLTTRGRDQSLPGSHPVERI